MEDSTLVRRDEGVTHVRILLSCAFITIHFALLRHTVEQNRCHGVTRGYGFLHSLFLHVCRLIGVPSLQIN